MKRSPLKRTTRLIRRAPLRKMSAKKRGIQREYRESIMADLAAQVRAVGYNFCSKCKRRCYPGPHHPNGRTGRKILNFVLLCWPCHQAIHGNTKRARVEGWLSPIK
jgi:hypothetical protein